MRQCKNFTIWDYMHIDLSGLLTADRSKEMIKTVPKQWLVMCFQPCKCKKTFKENFTWLVNILEKTIKPVFDKLTWFEYV